MTIRNDGAPSAFAEAARTTFIYAPIVGVVGALMFAIGGIAGIDFFTFMGVAAYLSAAVTGLVGVAGMIREGQHLLARQHEAAGLAIASYQSAALGNRGSRNGVVGGPPGMRHVTPIPPVPVPAPSMPADAARVPRGEAPGDPAALSVADVGADVGADVRQEPSTEPLDFVGLLKSLYILDAARDVRRLYGNDTCASFVNRKCADNGIPPVNLTGTDIPENF